MAAYRRGRLRLGTCLSRFMKGHRAAHKGSKLLRVAPLLSASLYLVCALAYFSGAEVFPPISTLRTTENPGLPSRKLLSTDDNSTSNLPPWEQCDFELNSGHATAWAVFHLITTIFSFIGLAVICDDFFVPSLEVISEKLKLSEDVAGATFMAAGSSAPELFTSVAGVAQESDVGVGTIVGSAVFNILMIIALTGLLARKMLTIDCRPLTRDISFYTMSIIVFVIVAWDGQVQWYESLVLLSLYVCYIIVMRFNSHLMKQLGKLYCGKILVSPDEKGQPTEETAVCEDMTDSVLRRGSGSLHRASFTGGHARRLSLIHSLHAQSSSSHAPMETAHELLSPRDQPNGGMPQLFKYTEGLPASRSTVIQDPDKGSNGAAPAPLNMVVFPDKTHQITTSQSMPAVVSVATERGSVDSGIVSKPSRLPPLHHPVSTSGEQNGNNNATPPGMIPEDVDGPVEKAPIDDKDLEASKECPGSCVGEEKSMDCDGAEAVEEEEAGGIATCPCVCCPRIKAGPPSRPSPFNCCCSGTLFVLKWFIYVLSFPYYYIFTLTIPDCSTDSNKKFYLLTFTMSVLWIAALSFAMTTIMGRFGCILSIDPFSMGLVVIAIGTSVPDCLSSILVARDGYGDMAVSNAIGSNVFDINLGLGLPMLIKNAIYLGGPVNLLSDYHLEAKAEGRLVMSSHSKFGFILCGIVLVVYTTFIVSKFRLSRWMSGTFICLYALFLTYAFIQESDICDRGLTC